MQSLNVNSANVIQGVSKNDDDVNDFAMIFKWRNLTFSAFLFALLIKIDVKDGFSTNLLMDIVNIVAVFGITKQDKCLVWLYY